MGAAAIFAGTFVKTLKDQILLNTTARILTGTVDPSSSATLGEKGSLYLRQGTVGELYVKQDTGSSVNWSKVSLSATLSIPDGTAAAPGLAFASTGNTNTGIYLATTDSLGFSADGVAVGNYSATGAWTLGAGAGSGLVHSFRSNATTELQIVSTAGAGNTNSILTLAALGTTGQAIVNFNRAGSLQWKLFNNASITDAFNLVNATSKTLLNIKQAGNVVLGDSSLDVIHTAFGSLDFQNTSTALPTNAGIYKSAANTLAFATAATNAGKIDSNGAWTLGAAVTQNYTGARHLISGALYGANVTSTDFSGELLIGNNIKFGVAGNAQDGRTDATTNGSGIVFENTATATNKTIRFFTNAPGDLTSTVATEKGSMTGAGAWTFGPSAAAVIHTFNTTGSTGVTKMGSVSANRPGLTLDSGANNAALSLVANGSGTAVDIGYSVVLQFINDTYAHVSSASDFGYTGTVTGSVATTGGWTLGVTAETSDHTSLGTHSFKKAVAAGSNNYPVVLKNLTNASDVRVGVQFQVNVAGTAGYAIKVANDGSSGGTLKFAGITSGSESETGSVTAGGRWALGPGTTGTESTPSVTLRTSSNQNHLEWGYTTAGYGSNLGYLSGGASPFIGFACSAGTNSGTFKTTGGLTGAAIDGGLGNGLRFWIAPTASADNQGTLVGTASQTGFWTFGSTTGSGTPHLFQSGGQTNLAINSPTGNEAVLAFKVNATTLYTILQNTGGTLDFRASGTTVNGSVTSGGLWTLGASGGSSTHVINGALQVTTRSASSSNVSAFFTNTGILSTVSSSLRYKENVVNLELDSSKIFQLRPVSFDYLNDSQRERRVNGLIAEEVFQILPELVAMKEINPDDGPVPDNVYYHELPILLLAELKKLRNEFDAYINSHP